jgi:diguanylate cyclase (GGDEF)-like protein
MAIKIATHRDVLRHTAVRVVIAVTLTIALTLVLTLLQFGAEPDAMVRAGFATTSALTTGIVISALLTAGLTYKSALTMLDLTRARTDLLRISCTDQLTGLLNRRGFDEAAASAMLKSGQEGHPITVLMCDIDHFKAINDQFGHEFGDKVLVEIAEVFRAYADGNEMLVARHGGEEFAAMMTGVREDLAIRCAEDLRQACAVREITSGDVSACATISVGLATCHGGADLPKLMRMADQALYAAKNRGRNRVVRADALADAIAA